MLNAKLIELLYGAASIRRWNDHIRPDGFSELDKQAHKMVIAYMIFHLSPIEGFDWGLFLDRAFYEFVHRVIVTDINPQIYRKIEEKKSDELNKFVNARLEDQGIYSLVKSVFESKDILDETRIERRVLSAAHDIATMWEFNIIHDFNKRVYDIEATGKLVSDRLEEHYDLNGVQKLMLKKKAYSFIDLCGKLRYQIRWSQTPRLPETSVLGHMLIVAFVAYMFCKTKGANEKRTYNDFFGGLFHDLPEALTRDIINPVKKGVEDLSPLLSQIEISEIKEKVLPLLPNSAKKDIVYFLIPENGNGGVPSHSYEFQNKYIETGGELIITGDDIPDDKTSKEFNPYDGKMIKECDNLAAFAEVILSKRFGINSNEINGAYERIKDKYIDKDFIRYSINLSDVYKELDLSLEEEKEKIVETNQSGGEEPPGEKE